ncbi:unnamed protein product [Arctogadus glacialis]
MMHGSKISATRNLWVVSVFPTFTGSGSFPSILASSPVTGDGGTRVHEGPAGMSLDGTEEVEAVCVAHSTNLVIVLKGVYGEGERQFGAQCPTSPQRQQGSLKQRSRDLWRSTEACRCHDAEVFSQALWREAMDEGAQG